MKTDTPSESKDARALAMPQERKSIDPIVAQVHAVREQQWRRYGDDTRAWFDALLQAQARRLEGTKLA